MVAFHSQHMDLILELKKKTRVTLCPLAKLDAARYFHWALLFLCVWVMHDNILFRLRRVELVGKICMQFVRLESIFRLGTHEPCSAAFAELMR